MDILAKMNFFKLTRQNFEIFVATCNSSTNDNITEKQLAECEKCQYLNVCGAMCDISDFIEKIEKKL
jgi:radical SAM protein with 4Fe4S-binding SPASM domain